MTVDLSRVESPNRNTDFLHLPYRLYKGHAGWVPPLISEEQERLDTENYPFFSHSDAAFFLARRDGQPVGRIAAIENTRHNDYHDEHIGFFGFLDAVDDRTVFKQLIAAAENWISDRNLERMRGPASYSSNEMWGAMIDGYDRPCSILMPYNPPYLPDHLESLGFEPTEQLLALETDTDIVNLDFLQRISDRVEQNSNLRVRPIDLNRFEEEAQRLREIYTECWSDNWGFVPPTDEEFEHTCAKLKPLVENNPEFVLFIGNEDEEVGFIAGVPDVNMALNQLNGQFLSWRLIPFLWKYYVTGIDRVRVLLMGVTDAYRGNGLELVLIKHFIDHSTSYGYSIAELSWILESNDDMINILQRLNSREVSRYNVYDRELE